MQANRTGALARSRRTYTAKLAQLKLTDRITHQQAKTGALVLVGLLVLAAIAILIARPAYEASAYHRHLNAAAGQLHRSLTSLANTTQNDVFNDPDGTAIQHVGDLAAIKSRLQTTQSQLTAFGNQSGQLPAVPYIAYFSTYGQARIDQHNAAIIISQTRDVLRQYAALLVYLMHYYEHDDMFDRWTGRVNRVSHLNTLRSQASQLDSQGTTLQSLASQLKHQSAPAGYEPLQQTAADIYEQAGRGLTVLASGLTAGRDADVQYGINLVEQATNQHDDQLANLPTQLSQQSYTLQQVSQLPTKTDEILDASQDGN